MKKKKLRIFIPIILVIFLVVAFAIFFPKNSSDLKSISSKKQLEKFYEGDSISDGEEILLRIVGMPFSAFMFHSYRPIYSTGIYATDTIKESDALLPTTNGASTSASESVSSSDYSKTNIQVENVDEADINKTDGNYIYSISGSDVVITDVRNPEKIEVVSTISPQNSGIAQDLILDDNTLVVISASDFASSWQKNTTVGIYDITDREKPVLQKGYELQEPYYTSRCINHKLYVISSGYLRKSQDEIVTYYLEDFAKKEIELNKIQYLKDLPSRNLTLIASTDLQNPKKDISVNSYLMDISNCYVSENNIYLFDQEYEYNSNPSVKSLFTWAGALGPFIEVEKNSSNYGYQTKVIKFAMEEDGHIEFTAKASVAGRSINQYSFDEKDGNLRLALYDNNGSRIVVLDNHLKELGRTPDLAAGEKMYSSRFMGNRAYLVTYKTIDPLYVVDLSNPSKPAVLGELKIPGYSTYLHPYDENHLIGIGMDTTETVRRNSSGKVISTTASVTGMKMALFDVSNVSNPKQLYSTTIGDSRTTSAILTNPKALLFSKEKELIAIPVNRYAQDFTVTGSIDDYSSINSAYQNKSKSYLAEGYIVYQLNLKDGFVQKGIITHDVKTTYGYSSYSKMLRGLYIDQNLFTVSETAIKVNDLDTLAEKCSLSLDN